MYLHEKKVVCAFFFSIILPLTKYSLVTKDITFNIKINKFMWTYYVHKQFISSLNISNAIYEHCKQKHTNNETQFRKQCRPSKNTTKH